MGNWGKEDITGLWFGTFSIFPYIGKNNPNLLILFRGVETTNQFIINYLSMSCNWFGYGWDQWSMEGFPAVFDKVDKVIRIEIRYVDKTLDMTWIYTQFRVICLVAGFVQVCSGCFPNVWSYENLWPIWRPCAFSGCSLELRCLGSTGAPQSRRLIMVHHA